MLVLVLVLVPVDLWSSHITFAIGICALINEQLGKVSMAISSGNM